VLPIEHALELLDAAAGGQRAGLGLPVAGEPVSLGRGLEIVEFFQLLGEAGQFLDGGRGGRGGAQQIEPGAGVAGREVRGGLLDLAGEAQGAAEEPDAGGRVDLGVRLEQHEAEGLVEVPLLLVARGGGGQISLPFEDLGVARALVALGYLPPEATDQRHGPTVERASRGRQGAGRGSPSRRRAR
jgi:hypothetical protein